VGGDVEGGNREHQEYDAGGNRSHTGILGSLLHETERADVLHIRPQYQSVVIEPQ
jgi:hypothetical protein